MQYIQKSMVNPEFFIEVIPQSRIDLASIALLELMRDGYGFKDDAAYLEEQTHHEYAGRGKITFFVTHSSRVIGSLTVNDGRYDLAQSELAGYWEHLEPRAKERLLSYSKQIVGINGIVVLPQYQGLGLGQKLLAEMIGLLQPALIIGGTKTPSAVLARSKILDKLGYRSFYGFAEVTPSQPKQSTTIHLPFAQAHWATRKVTPEGIYFKSTDILLPTVPDVTTMPDYIATAFQPVIAAQQAMGDTQTAVTSLLSIHSSVFKEPL